MDWGKAKNILIIVFLILNIFMLGNISLNALSQNNSKEAIAITESILQSKNIRLESKIPSFTGAMGKIEINDEAYFNMQRAAAKLMGSKAALPSELKSGQRISDQNKEFTIEDNAAFTYRDSNPQEKWDVTQKKSLEKRIRKFISDIGISEAEFVLDSYDQLSDGAMKLVFVHKYQGLYIFSNTMTAVITEFGVKELACSIKKPVGISRDAQKVIPAYKILLTSYGNSPNTVITSIDIGYNMDMLDKDMKTFYAAPVWRIKTKDRKPEYFDAIIG